MRASNIKSDVRYEQRDDSRFGIVNWGIYNDYPQRILEIAAASGTATVCFEKYAKFIEGDGFVDQTFWKTYDQLHADLCDRAARLGAVALHIEYDGLLNPIGYKFVPTEYVRIIKGHPDEIIEDYNGYAVYNNWDRRKCSRVKTEDIKYFIKFTNDKEALKKSIKKLGGFSKFKGCVYFSTGNAYPLPKIDSVIGDVAGEDSISTIKCRNARSNFLPSSMVIEKGGQMYSNYINLKAGSKKEEDYSDYDRRLISYMDNVLENNSNRWKDFQGDENALKMMLYTVAVGEEAPEIKTFPVTNLDKMFEYSETSMQKNIYKRFDLPVALRGVDTPGKLGSSQEIKDAYDYYNSVTNKERRAFERMYTDLFLNFVDIKSINPTMDFSIIPMKYISSSDKEMTEQVSTDKSKEDEPVD